MDRQEFSDRVEACQARMYRVALTITGNSADAEDMVQDALLRAWRALGQLRDERYFETWLMRILINLCRSELRSRSGRAWTNMAVVPELVSPPPPDPALFEALERLDGKYRLPLMLHCAEGYTMDEVARMLRLPMGAVKWRIRQGRIRLAKVLEEDAL